MLPIFAKVGICWHGWHAFRRGPATDLHGNLQVNDKTVQAILRHSNVSITQQCYIKAMPEQSVAAMNRFDEVVCADCAPAT
jgi:integrase